MRTRFRSMVVLLLACLLCAPVLLQSQSASALFEQALLKENAEGSLKEAIAIFSRIADDGTADPAIRARAQLHVGICYEKLGDAQARAAYERLIADFPGQTSEVAAARARLAALAETSKERAAGPVFRKITIPGEISASAQLSPDGGRLAMAAGRDIWVVDLRGQVAPEIAGVPEQLTHGANAASTGLTWSGNGQWIAYNEYTIPTRNMYVLPVSGGSPRKLTRPVPLLGNGPWSLGLSADGSRLAYTTIEAQNQRFLRIVSTITGELVMRLGNPAASQPRFSPDDAHVAYVRQQRGSSFGAYPAGEVRVVRLTDGSDFPVTKTPAVFRSLAWSPDGRLLALLALPDKNDRSVQEVWITPVVGTGELGGEPTRVKLTRYTVGIAGWTADNRIGMLCLSPERNAVYTVPLSGGKATQVTPDSDTFLPQWSPDAKRIYFRWGQNDIASVPAAGGQVSVVPRTGEVVSVTMPGGGIHISPDGQRIAFSAGKKGIPGVHLWTMPITGGEPTQLTMKPDLNAWQPRWSPDGQWIAFESERKVSDDRKLDENIFVISSKGGEPRQLTRHTDCFCELSAWSPGGDSIAYACSDSTIRIVPIDGGAPRAVLKVDGLEHHQGSLAWTRDGARLAYSARGRLWTVSTAGGEPTAITTDLDGNILQFALSPDGKSIAFNAPSGGDTELWLMEGFLPLVNGK